MDRLQGVESLKFVEVEIDREVTTWEALATLVAYREAYNGKNVRFACKRLMSREVHFWIRDLPFWLRSLVWTSDPHDEADMRPIDVGRGYKIMIQKYVSGGNVISGFMRVWYKDAFVEVFDTSGWFGSDEDAVNKFNAAAERWSDLVPERAFHRATSVLDRLVPDGINEGLDAYRGGAAPTTEGSIFSHYFGCEEGDFVRLDDNGHYLRLIIEFALAEQHYDLALFATDLWELKERLGDSELSSVFKRVYSAIVGRWARSHPKLAQHIYNTSRRRMDQVAKWNRSVGGDEYRRYVDSTLTNAVSERIEVGTKLGQFKSTKFSRVSILTPGNVLFEGEYTVHSGMREDDLTELDVLSYFSDVWPEPLNVTTSEFDIHTLEFVDREMSFTFKCSADCRACAAGARPSEMLHDRARGVLV